MSMTFPRMARSVNLSYRTRSLPNAVPQGSVLLSHGDKLQLSSSVRLYYFSNSGAPEKTSLLDKTQFAEMEVAVMRAQIYFGPTNPISFCDQDMTSIHPLSSARVGTALSSLPPMSQLRSTWPARSCLCITLSLVNVTWAVQWRHQSQGSDSKKPFASSKFSNISTTPILRGWKRSLEASSTSTSSRSSLPAVTCFPMPLRTLAAFRKPTLPSSCCRFSRGSSFWHDVDVVHRDLKPDNVLLTSATGSPRIVLTDFGHARRLPDDDQQPPAKRRRMHSVRGTFEYTAP